jgi:hypothetical protein
MEVPQVNPPAVADASAGFFDFLLGRPRYPKNDVIRLNLRHRFLIEPYRAQLEGAMVLDLASHDGRWPYALAGAGARHVLGFEARQHLIDEFREYPETDFKKRVRLEQADIFDGLRRLVACGVRVDVVAIFGVYYHIMDHHYLLRLVHQLQPNLIIVDSDFMMHPWPYIAMMNESAEKDLHGLAAVAGNLALVGVPSRKAMEKIAESLSYELQWLDWERLPPAERVGIGDYYNEGDRRRGSCVLRPIGN